MLLRKGNAQLAGMGLKTGRSCPASPDLDIVDDATRDRNCSYKVILQLHSRKVEKGRIKRAL